MTHSNGMHRHSAGVWVAPPVDELQSKLPQYEVIEILGRGGMGAVYKAQQKSLKRLVAIKILPPGMADDEFKFAERFQNEAQTMAQMNHPAIISVHDFGETSDGLLYFVMEFVDGTDVQKMITAQGRLASEQALAITAHVCDALSYAHKRGVIHRDIKPANILIDQEGHIKVTDFGLAKIHDSAQTSGLTRTNVAMGTPDYVAPEVLTPGKGIDHRADIYSAGVMLYQMLTGEVPRGMFKLPSQRSIGSDLRFDEIICRAMEQDREDRYQSATEMRHALDGILITPQAKKEGTGLVASKDSSQRLDAKRPLPPNNRSLAPAPERAQIQAKRLSPSVVWLFIGGIVAALGVAGFFMFGGKPEPQPDNASTRLETTELKPANSSSPASDASPAASSQSLPMITAWRDITEAVREKARGTPGVMVDESAVRKGKEKGTPSVELTPPGMKDYAVRVRYTGEVQVGLRRQDSGAFLFVLAQLNQTLFKRYEQGATSDDLSPAKRHPADFDPAREHEFIVTMQGSQLRAWMDGVPWGDASDDKLTTGGAALMFVAQMVVKKVEIAEIKDEAPSAEVVPPPAITNWQDVTNLLRESVRTKTGFTVDSAGVFRAPGASNGDTMVMRPGEKDRAVRVRYVGQAQVSLWIKSGNSSAYVLASRDRVMIKKQLQKYGEAESVMPSVVHPVGFDPMQPHELIVTVREAIVDVWLDGRHIARTEDTALKDCSIAIVPMVSSTVQKVDIAELDGGTAKDDWQPIFMKREDFGGDLRDVEFRDDATFLKTRSHLAPATSSSGGIRATLRSFESDRTGSLTIRSTEKVAYGEEDFGCTAFISGAAGVVMKVRDRTTGSSELKRHDFALSPALKPEESFVFELRATDGKITVKVNGHEVGSVPDRWTGGLRRFGITPSNLEFSEFRDVAVMRTK